jgi:hypothetical protein
LLSSKKNMGLASSIFPSGITVGKIAVENRKEKSSFESPCIFNNKYLSFLSLKFLSIHLIVCCRNIECPTTCEERVFKLSVSPASKDNLLMLLHGKGVGNGIGIQKMRIGNGHKISIQK